MRKITIFGVALWLMTTLNLSAASTNAMPAIVSYLMSSENTSVSTSKVLKTRQTKCYNFSTNEEESCNETHKGQDGYYQKGVARSYTRANDIVTDNVTKLQWQDNAEVASNDMNWTDAITYCNNLNLHNDSSKPWHLPTIDELDTILEYGRIKGQGRGIYAINPVFQNIAQSDWNVYWSSTTAVNYYGGTSWAWRVSFVGSIIVEHKAKTYYVRCAR